MERLPGHIGSFIGGQIRNCGGHVNALMPWLVGSALLLGLTLQRLATGNAIVRFAVLALSITQLGLLFEDPRGFLPTPAMRK